MVSARPTRAKKEKLLSFTKDAGKGRQLTPAEMNELAKRPAPVRMLPKETKLALNSPKYGSLKTTIPKEVVEILGLKTGSSVVWEINSDDSGYHAIVYEKDHYADLAEAPYSEGIFDSKGKKIWPRDIEKKYLSKQK